MASLIGRHNNLVPVCPPHVHRGETGLSQRLFPHAHPSPALFFWQHIDIGAILPSLSHGETNMAPQKSPLWSIYLVIKILHALCRLPVCPPTMEVSGTVLLVKKMLKADDDYRLEENILSPSIFHDVLVADI